MLQASFKKMTVDKVSSCTIKYRVFFNFDKKGAKKRKGKKSPVSQNLCDHLDHSRGQVGQRPVSRQLRIFTMV